MKTYALDHSIIEENRSLGTPGEDDFLQTLISLFMEHAPGTLQSLRTAVIASEPKAIVHFAHKLAGLSGNLGAIHLSEICECIEEKAHRNTLSETFDLLSRAEKEFDQAVSEILLLSQ